MKTIIAGMKINYLWNHIYDKIIKQMGEVSH